jgi:uncharacterized protein (DUF1015 family)
MPTIRPFRGLRYNLAQVGSLSEVVAPPYDVIDEDFQERLYAASPYNFVRLELTKREPTDTGDEAVYERAASLFRQWVRDGVLQFEPDPAVYVYHQVFDYAGRTHTRRGFMTRVELERFGEGKIYPHEQTHSKAKDDRLRLTRACCANMSQIYGLYPDPQNQIQNVLEAVIAGTAGIEAVDHLGVTHRLWPITSQQVIGEVSSLIEDLPMFVADGHHRYETACNYRDELAAESGGTLPADHPANFVLTMVMSMDDPGLLVLPTHRLFHGVHSLNAEDLAARIGNAFDCEIVGEGSKATEQVWQQIEELDDQGAMALFTRSDQKWTLLTANEHTAEHMQRVASDQSLEWRSLGVSMLHSLVIDDLLELRGHPKPKYVHLVEEVVDGLEGRLGGSLEDESQANAFELAALVMPASVDDIRKVSLHRERMPAKSTYFYPKLLSGLVINPLDNS